MRFNVMISNSPGVPVGGALMSGVGYGSGGVFDAPVGSTTAITALGGDFATLAVVVDAGVRGDAGLAVNLAFSKLGNLYVEFPAVQPADP